MKIQLMKTTEIVHLVHSSSITEAKKEKNVCAKWRSEVTGFKTFPRHGLLETNDNSPCFTAQ